MRYVIEAIDRGELQAEVLYTHGRSSTSYPEKEFVHWLRLGSLFHHRFYGSWVLSSLYILWFLRIGKRYELYSRIWFADRFSALFCALSRRIREKSVVMVNDYSRIRRRGSFRGRGPGRMASAGYWSASVFYFLERWICRRSSVVVASSEYLTGLLRNEYALAGKVVRLYKAVDLEIFHARESEPCTGPAVSVLFVKNEWYVGGLDILLRALAELDVEGMTLTIVGKGQAEEVRSFERLIRDTDLESKVELKGLVDRSEMPQIFRAADIFCVPSRNEALGVSILEALATGTPVVASDVGGIPEALDHGEAGWMVSPEDVGGLASALLQVVREPEVRARKQRHGFRHVAGFSRTSMIAGIHEISRR